MIFPNVWAYLRMRFRETWQNSGQKSKDVLNDDRRYEGRFSAKPVGGFPEDVRSEKDPNHEDGLKVEHW